MARSHITTGVCHSADMPMLQRCQANTAQTFWPQTPAACVINMHYCTCRRSGIYTKCITFPCCHGHTQETQHELNTTLPRVGCVRMQVYMCSSTNVQGPGWSLLSRAGTCVSVSCFAQTVWDEQLTIHPPTHANTCHTHMTNPFHDEVFRDDREYHVNKSWSCCGEAHESIVSLTCFWCINQTRWITITTNISCSYSFCLSLSGRRGFGRRMASKCHRQWSYSADLKVKKCQ